MRVGKINGWHVAFLTFAISLLSVPAMKGLVLVFDLSAEWARTWGRLLPLLVMGCAVAYIAWRFPDSIRRVMPRLPADRRQELLVVTLAKVTIPFAVIGAGAAWFLATEGSVGLERRYAGFDYHAVREASTYAPSGLLVALLVGPILAPVIEEIVFRGFLYNLWAERWGWFPSMLLTSILFGAYHHNYISAFLGSIVYVCLYRRTGTLVAPMVSHAAFNLAMFYPFFGQFLFPPPMSAFGDITTWWPQLACLAFVVVALPAYVFMSRHERHQEQSA